MGGVLGRFASMDQRIEKKICEVLPGVVGEVMPPVIQSVFVKTLVPHIAAMDQATLNFANESLDQILELLKVWTFDSRIKELEGLVQGLRAPPLADEDDTVDIAIDDPFALLEGMCL